MVPDTKIEMPATSSELRRETRSDLPGVPRPGCLYTGPTSITLNPDGTMTVRSPWTKFTQTSGDGDTAARNDPGRCGTPGTAAGQLGSTGGATVPVVEGSLVFVQNVPAGPASPSDPPNMNYTEQSATEKLNRCGASDGSKNGVGYPLANESLTGSSAYSYGCTAGDVFVQGQLKGHMSIAAENYLWVVGDTTKTAGGVTYATPDSVLGLVGQKSVIIWHPVTSAGVNIGSVKDVNINGAVLSVAGTMAVQNYDRGAHLGNVILYGAVAQKYLNATECMGCGAGTTGFGTSFTYDTRLKTISPPKFLQPSITTFQVTEFAEVTAAFNTDGSLK